MINRYNMFLLSFFVIVFLLYSGCKTKDEKVDKTEKTDAADTTDDQVYSETVIMESEEMPGGFTYVEPDSGIALSAFDFLKEELKKGPADILLEEVVEARIQVVAGTNTVIVCRYSDKESGKEGFLYAKIYEDLDKKRQLTALNLEYEYIP